MIVLAQYFINFAFRANYANRSKNGIVHQNMTCGTTLPDSVFFYIKLNFTNQLSIIVSCLKTCSMSINYS